MAKNSSVAGVPANHSSLVDSVPAGHAQSDDAANSTAAGNISGSAPTGDTYTWQAGPLNAWQENDDYRQFGPGRMDAPCSRLDPYGMNDGDYDDNGGIPLAEGHSYGHVSSVDAYDHQAIGLNAVIVRRA